MPNLYNPAKRTIGELLTVTNPPIVVPDWQRNFSWTSSEAETFWEDLIAFDRTYPGQNIDNQEYFLGSVVIVDNVISHLLLDGQQRLATAAIFLSVIRDFLARYNQNAAVRLAQRYLSDFDDASNQRIFKLTLNHYDKDFYRREILEERTADYAAPDPQIQSHRLIREVREVFEKHFEVKYLAINNPQESYNWALRMQKVLTTHVSVVAIISVDEDNAATVFETLNDRGIGLSTPDLLRNFLLRTAQEEDRNEIVSLWGDIFEIDDEIKIDTFLRHYWLSKAGDVKTKSLFREIKGALVEQQIPSLIFTRELAENAETYKELVLGQIENEQGSKYLKDVRELGANLLYPVLLSGFTVYNENDFSDLVKELITLFVRYNVIGKLENSPLETFCYNLAKDIRTGLALNAVRVRVREVAPINEQFSTQFAQASVSRRDSARYILREIELRKRQTQELEVAPPSKVHIEHIYPQTPLAGQRWGNHNSQINKLGNLTLLDKKLNAAIKNSVFAGKKPSYEQSQILLTQDLLPFEQWNPETIAQRQTAMTALALQIWNLD